MHFHISSTERFQNVDYNPDEGFRGKGKPELVFSHGTLIIEHGKYTGAVGHGRFILRQPFSVI